VVELVEGVRQSGVEVGAAAAFDLDHHVGPG
jgi:hypothetical protein